MKISVSKRVEIILNMTVEEAEWLSAVMQNPLHGQKPTEEDMRDRSMRMRFFNSLVEEL